MLITRLLHLGFRVWWLEVECLRFWELGLSFNIGNDLAVRRRTDGVGFGAHDPGSVDFEDLKVA